jgi:hypothetical protein
MQMAEYNLQYALSIPDLKVELRAITAANTTRGLSDSQLNDIRALVLPDWYSWATAAWYLTAMCANVRPALQAGRQAAWEAYLGCIGTSVTDDRLAYWNRANTALHLT